MEENKLAEGRCQELCELGEVTFEQIEEFYQVEVTDKETVV